MSLVQDLDNSDLISHAPWQTGVSSLLLVLHMFSISFLSLILFVLLRQRLLSSYHKLLVNFLIAQLAACLADFITASSSLGYQKFSLGKIGCEVFGIVFLAAPNVWILSIIAMSIDVYLKIVHLRNLTEKEVNFIISQIWTMPVIMLVICYATRSEGFLIGLHSSRLYCTIASWNTSALLVLIEMPLSIVSLLLAGIILGYVHFSIYSFFAVLARRGSKMNSGDSATSTTTNATEKMLLHKAICLTSSFFVLWMPLIVKFCIEFVNGQPVDPQIDAFAFTMAASDPLANAILIFSFDMVVRKELRKLFGIKERPPRPRKHKAMKMKSRSPSVLSSSKSETAAHPSQPSSKITTTVKVGDLTTDKMDQPSSTSGKPPESVIGF